MQTQETWLRLCVNVVEKFILAVLVLKFVFHVCMCVCVYTHTHIHTYTHTHTHTCRIHRRLTIPFLSAE